MGISDKPQNINVQVICLLLVEQVQQMFINFDIPMKF